MSTYSTGKGSRARLKRAIKEAVSEDWRERAFTPYEIQILSRYSGIPEVKIQAIGQLAILAVLGKWMPEMVPRELKASPPLVTPSAPDAPGL
jgi:hypothetical protein